MSLMIFQSVAKQLIIPIQTVAQVRPAVVISRLSRQNLWIRNFHNRSKNKFLSLNLLHQFSTKGKMSGRPNKVFVSRPDIPQVALDLLREHCEVTTWNQACTMPRDLLLKSVQGMDGYFCFITDKIDLELLNAAGPNLKVIGTMSVGHDHVDVEAVKAKKIKLGYTPDVLTDATAELTLAVLLAASRRLFESHAELLSGGWEKSAWGPTWMCGMGLQGSTVGIFGLGRIGQAVLSRLRPFGVSRFVYNGRGKRDDVTEAEYLEFDEFLKQSDFVIVTAALNATTKEIFNERAFSLMKPTAVFVNTSRGGLVKQNALIEALKANKIFSAGLDVMTPEPLPTDHELLKLRNCVVIPHIGSATHQSRNHMALLTARNIIAALTGSEMPAQLC